jgi:hypothetical protein
VVALDVRGARTAAGLDDVGVERALHEERIFSPSAAASATRSLHLLEGADELAADDLALLSGSLTPARRRGTSRARRR